mgnify:CR=1 FL=1
MKPLTPTQKKALDFIKQSYKKHGWMPSLKEIALNFNVAIPSVFETLIRLENKGWIQRSKGEVRQITIL